MTEKIERHKMTWKVKHLLQKSPLIDDDDLSDEDTDEEFWFTKTTNKPKSSFKPCIETGNKLKDEGIKLAEKGYLNEALTKWNAAINHKPNDHTLHEMQAQVLMMLDKFMPSVQAAERCVQMNKLWSTGWETLARTQLNIQDHYMALKSFSRSYFLNPTDEEVKDQIISTKTLISQLEQIPDPVEDFEKEEIDA